MNQPVVSLDVSKGKSFVAIYRQHGVPYAKPFSINHTTKDLNLVLKRMSDLEQETHQKPEVVMEATGIYAKGVLEVFQNANYQVTVLNPLETHRLKQSHLRKVKTDAIDAQQIAELFYRHAFAPKASVDPSIAELKNLCRQYYGLMDLYTAAQLRYRTIVDQLFPGLETVFSDICGVVALKLISSYPTPLTILSAAKEDILEIIKLGNQSHTWPETKVKEVIAAAHASLSCSEAQASNVQVLRMYADILLTYQRHLAHVRAQITAVAELCPAYHLLLTIPGVGEKTSPVLLSEIEDVCRFPSPKQLVAFAGIDPSVFQSGKFKASRNRISKRGSTYLRAALYQVVFVAVRKRKTGYVNPTLAEFYYRKRSEGKSHKVAMMATANKLLRIIYAVWTKHEPFRVEV